MESIRTRGFWLWAASVLIAAFVGPEWAFGVAATAALGTLAFGWDLHVRKLGTLRSNVAAASVALWLALACAVGFASWHHVYWNLERLDPAALSGRIGPVLADLEALADQPIRDADLLSTYRRFLHGPVSRFGKDLRRRGLLGSVVLEIEPKTRSEVKERARTLRHYWQCLLGTC